MLYRLAWAVVSRPLRTIVVAALTLLAAAVFAVPVIGALSTGGFEDPDSPSSRARHVLTEDFNRGDASMIFTVTSPTGARSDEAGRVGAGIVELLEQSPHVLTVSSLWTAPPEVAAALLSKDGTTGLVVAELRGDENEIPRHAERLAAAVGKGADGVTVRAGGDALAFAQINKQSQMDLLVMESLAVPVVFLVLVWVFGGVVAAGLPLTVGGCAIIGALAVLRLVTFFSPVSVFALNLSIALGLALAIDYTLLIVSRYREEVAAGKDQQTALVRAVTTAGRTVMFSALIVTVSMATMLLFPMYFLKSFAYAGVAVVFLAAISAVVITPAAIAALGPRFDALKLPWSTRDKGSVARPVEAGWWYRCVKRVMRHPVIVAVSVTSVLIVLGLPFVGAVWGSFDDRVLPPSASARQVGDSLRADFQAGYQNDVVVVIPDARGLTSEQLETYAAELSRLPEVARVSAPEGSFVGGVLTGPPSSPSGRTERSAFLTATSTAPLFSAQSSSQLERIDALPTPGGRDVLVTGAAAVNRDNTEAIVSRAPLVLALIASIMFVLLFILTGSVVLPVKALILNVLTLSATFGALVWVFQDGHLGGMGTTPTGTLVIHTPMLLFCIAFGLSMDYEVFVIARIREYFVASPPSARDNGEAVALGIARTGRVVTAAALIMSISFVALLAAQVSFMKMCGLGLTLAVLVDATLVRMLLLPAGMQLLGRANWWAPAPLARLHARLEARTARMPHEVRPVPG